MGFLFFIAIWHIVIYCPVAHITWNPHGYFPLHHVQDFSGAVVVHLLSSATLLSMTAFLNHQKVANYAVKIPDNNRSALLGSLLVWLLYFGLSVGKAHDASPVAAQALVNTVAAVQVSILTGFLLDSCFSARLARSPISMVNSVLLGLVSVSALSGYTTVGGALFSAVVTSLVVKLVARYLLADGVDEHDPLNCVTVHGVGGTVAFLMAAVSSYRFVNPAAQDGLTHGGAHQAMQMHVAAALALWACVCLAVLCLLFLCDLVVPLNPKVGTERVFLPNITGDLPAESLAPAHAAGPEGAPEQRAYELERDVSLYKKLSRYFSSNRSFS
jgi:ammonium transporter, Amt family